MAVSERRGGQAASQRRELNGDGLVNPLANQGCEFPLLSGSGCVDHWRSALLRLILSWVSTALFRALPAVLVYVSNAQTVGKRLALLRVQLRPEELSLELPIVAPVQHDEKPTDVEMTHRISRIAWSAQEPEPEHIHRHAKFFYRQIRPRADY